MNAYDYLIVGGGMTADAAIRGIRERDKDGTIAMVSAEADPPYSRPPLSKGLWSGKKTVEDIDCGTQELNVSLILNRKVTEILRSEHCVIDSENEVYGYNRLLLATGGVPRRLPFDDDGVVYYRSLQDYRTLSAGMNLRRHFAVVGGGFIGCEMAAALAGQKKSVTMIFPDEAPGSAIFPAELAQALAGYYLNQGITLMEELRLSGIETLDRGYALHLENGRMLEVDGVVAGIGIEPAVGLAEQAGLNVDNGIIVDQQLKTSDDSIYAAGDVANFYNPALDRRLRVEHEDNALTMGRMAGRNMAGAEEEYTHLPFFYSDLFEVGYEAVGLMDASLQTVGIWNGLQEPGVWAYLSDGQVCGVLLWNLFGQVDAGRALIESRERLPGTELEKKLVRILEAGDE